jgi:hypothetical protein
MGYLATHAGGREVAGVVSMLPRIQHYRYIWRSPFFQLESSLLFIRSLEIKMPPPALKTISLKPLRTSALKGVQSPPSFDMIVADNFPG